MVIGAATTAVPWWWKRRSLEHRQLIIPLALVMPATWEHTRALGHSIWMSLFDVSDYKCQCLKSLEFQSASAQPSPRQRKLSTKAAVQQVPGRLRRFDGRRSKVPKRRCFRRGLLGLGRIEDFAGFMLHLLWRDIDLVDHDPIRTKVKAFVGQQEMPLCCSTLPGSTILGNEES